VLGRPHSKKVFPDAQTDPPIFQFVPIFSGPTNGHRLKESGSTPFTSSLQIFLHTNQIPGERHRSVGAGAEEVQEDDPRNGAPLL